MDIIQQQQQQKVSDNNINKNHEDGRFKQEGKEEGQPPGKQQSPTSPASPPSANSSPSHEFSFTISLHDTSTSVPDKTKTSTASSFAIDLSPADDIFFHGHLLPLHFLSHLPVSPRSSTNSLDSFTLPIRDEPKQQPERNCSSSCSKSRSNQHHETKGRNKSKSLSQILSLKRWRKGYQDREKEREEDKEKHKRRLRFEVSQILKKYARLVRPLLSFKGKREDINICDRQSYNSFSGNLSMRRDKQDMTGRRGQYSAPASMRTSPTNSGLLVATAPLSSAPSDSTMEELQAAVQAAIAHCKNSISKGEKLQS